MSATESGTPTSEKDHAGQSSHSLTYWICGAIVAAIALALLFPHFAESFEVGGELFLRLLKMIVVPLVFTSVMSGILGLGDIRKIGKPGAATIGFFFITTALAVVVGLIVVNVIRPGVGTMDPAVMAKFENVGASPAKDQLRESLAKNSGLSEADVNNILTDLKPATRETPTVSQVVKNLLLMLVTDNLFVSASKTELLPIIVFAVLFGAMLTTMPTKVTSIVDLIQQSNVALMQFVIWLMYIAPLGIFCLVTARFGRAQAEGKFWTELQQIGWYFTAVLVGLAIHALVTLPLIFWLIRRENPYRFVIAISKSLLTAFSTASSSATLPITMENVEEAGISKRSAEFVLPLGATINMNGTALYEAAAALFIAQAVGIQMGLGQQMVVAVTATLAAIGAAGIPEAGLVTMLIVLNAVGLPIEYIGLILTVDWLLDRFRTAVNVMGDAVGEAVVDKTMA